MKKMIIAMAVVAAAGMVTVQTGSAETWRGEGRSGTHHGSLTEEQKAHHQTFRETMRELHAELDKDVIDGDRIAELRKELREMRAQGIAPRAPKMGMRGGNMKGFRGEISGPGRHHGRHAQLSEEQLAQRQEHRETMWELRAELDKDIIDGDRIAELRNELRAMRPEGSRHQGRQMCVPSPFTDSGAPSAEDHDAHH